MWSKYVAHKHNLTARYNHSVLDNFLVIERLTKIKKLSFLSEKNIILKCLLEKERVVTVFLISSFEEKVRTLFGIDDNEN